jgi:uncharacterized protein YndB with AHSA1/START domain/DNA-binding transcriptional ArsR family regulator
MDAATLTALAEPTRLRIVELLDERPHTVGEVAARLGLRQPQVTKHLQTLSRAGLVTVHPLGQRRVCALERAAFAQLRDDLGALAREDRRHAVLDEYRRAVEAERAAAAADPGWAAGRTARIARTLPAPPQTVWRYLTVAERMRTWWAPEHFTVADCAMEPRPGGAVRLVLQEGDGATHTATGRVIATRAPHELALEMAPLGPDGTPLFRSTLTFVLAPDPAGTALDVEIGITSSTAPGASAIAGMQLGWEQSLNKLANALTAS